MQLSSRLCQQTSQNTTCAGIRSLNSLGPLSAAAAAFSLSSFRGVRQLVCQLNAKLTESLCTIDMYPVKCYYLLAFGTHGSDARQKDGVLTIIETIESESNFVERED